MQMTNRGPKFRLPRNQEKREVQALIEQELEAPVDEILDELWLDDPEEMYDPYWDYGYDDDQEGYYNPNGDTEEGLREAHEAFVEDELQAAAICEDWDELPDWWYE